MRQQATFLMQSKFYSPAFNAAIFDGPIRIYFAQYQESTALKIYFELQEQLKELYFDARETYKKNGTHIFIMMYPTAETFGLSFGDKKSVTDNIVVDRLDSDYLVGVRGPIAEGEINQIANSLEIIIRELKAQAAASIDISAVDEATRQEVALAEL